MVNIILGGGWMDFINTKIDGVVLIKNNRISDIRGGFLKIFNKEIFLNDKIDFHIQESYYSISNKDVIRGMHFQLPPYEHEKMVNVIRGSIVDVILDLRSNSKTYKKYINVELSQENNMGVFIPKGCAHGFKSLEDNTVALYNVSTCYNSIADSGVRYDSFGMEWGVENPIVSDRDKGFKSLSELGVIF